ncbi:glycosyltransferase family 2 protein [Hyphomonas johnsonii]|uniref:Glycosyl transferase family 2 n=1 Tax=Hyphomonas johnsonii MHS-2 TaxID=1280950 RepID=A0A059FSZ1_9PROT|nr:glycosyltransferase family 2 protein [Hyphomonas johnsonii]KCZ93815.1 hypothetical protein HJO_00525 [Hyphomonas johnsonii MHS-2]
MHNTRLGVLAIMKNEAMNITEWLDHYVWLGCDSIFLIDNGSTDDTIARVEAHPFRDRIELVARSEPHNQVGHYREVYATLDIGSQVDWLIMADLDEFWFVKDGSSLKALLDKQMQAVDLIYTNWTVFGSSGHDEHPESLRRDLLSCRPNLAAHENTKWIARTAALNADWMYTHKVRDLDSRRIISNNVELQLNHYITQSREYWRTVKMVRGDASKAENDGVRTWDYFDRNDAACTAQDTRLSSLVGEAQGASLSLRASA